MGRLFWKFFLFVWLAHLTTILGVTTFFWWEQQQRQLRWQGLQPAGHLAGASRPYPSGKEPGTCSMLHLSTEMPPPPPHLPIEPLVAGLLASLAFATLLACYFSRPIRTLRSAFDAAATGDLEVRAEPAMGDRRDELADLGRDFDRMANRLQTLVDGQRRLLRDVSHELRPPLARLQAAIDLARQEPAKLEASMERIEKESIRMDRLVGELLTLSRLEAGMHGRRMEEIDLMELLSAIVTDARFEAQAKGVDVALTGSCDGFVDGDGELLHRAVENVVRNAVKYTPAGKAVCVATGINRAKGEVWIAVRDGGPGVPEGDLQAIFEPFYRGSHPTGSEGHGLGLAIARRVIESLDGRIGGANRAEGGFCMEIFLPVRVL